MAGDFKLAEAFVEINTRGLTATKRGLTAIRSGLTRLMAGFRSLGSVMRRAFSPMRMALGALGGAFAVRGLLKLASDAEEVGSKFATVFKNTSAEAEKTARNIARYMGASLTESKKAIGDLGDLFKPLGFAEEDALKLSAQMVKLGADISSFSNMPMDEALRRLTGTLVGSHENALKFGVVINENVLKEEMAILGTDKLTGSLKEQAKVSARLSLLMKGTADAQGDLARTSTSFANSMKRMWSLLKEVGELVGKTLIPIFSGLGNILSAVAEKFRGALEDAMPRMQEGLSRVKALLDGIAETVRSTEFGEWGKMVADAFRGAGAILLEVATDFGSLLMEGFKAIGKFLLGISVLVGQNIGDGIVKATKAAIGGDAGKVVADLWKAHKLGTATAAAMLMGEDLSQARRTAKRVTEGDPRSSVAAEAASAFAPVQKLVADIAKKYADRVMGIPLPPAAAAAAADLFGDSDLDAVQQAADRFRDLKMFSAFDGPSKELEDVGKAAGLFGIYKEEEKETGIAAGMHSFSSMWSSMQNKLSKGEEALLKEAKDANELHKAQVKLQKKIEANTRKGPAFA